MDYYDIISLLVFLRKQSQVGFTGINKIVEVIDNDSIPNEAKGEMFVSMLRELGLKEIFISNADDKIILNMIEEEQMIPYQFEIFAFNFKGRDFEFKVLLN